jgi:hypothetical protein
LIVTIFFKEGCLDTVIIIFSQFIR